MSEDRRTGEMMVEFLRATFTDVDAWTAAGEPATIEYPASLAVRDRLIAEDANRAHRALTLLSDVLQKSLSLRQEDAPPPAA